MGELDGFMRRTEKADEFVELFFSMGPYHKNNVYVTPPYEEFKRRLGCVQLDGRRQKRWVDHLFIAHNILYLL